MAADDVIMGFAECYTVAELQAFLKAALADLGNGVKVTNIQLEGGGGSGSLLKQDPATVVGMLRKAIQVRTANDAEAGSGDKYARRPPMGASMNFSTRRVRT